MLMDYVVLLVYETLEHSASALFWNLIMDSLAEVQRKLLIMPESEKLIIIMTGSHVTLRV